MTFHKAGDETSHIYNCVIAVTVHSLVLADLRQAFETPGLPITVHVIDGSTAGPGFRAAVKSQWVALGMS